jgi:hypothetical protein
VKICERHFHELERTKVMESSWQGRVPLNWFNSVQESAKFGDTRQLALADEKVSRVALFEMARSMNISTLTCCISIFAWGGMKIRHGVSLFVGDLSWLKLADEVRQGRLDRQASYQRFSQLRSEGGLSGMGPAYYTKLIFFLLPKCPHGYIMDQWTSASINLLFEQRIVKTKLAKGRRGLEETVADDNESADYEKFCNAVEEIADRLGVTPDHAEELMFSNGGRQKGHWRQYVISEREKRYEIAFA